jgi:hypothetical protein
VADPFGDALNGVIEHVYASAIDEVLWQRVVGGLEAAPDQPPP